MQGWRLTPEFRVPDANVYESMPIPYATCRVIVCTPAWPSTVRAGFCSSVPGLQLFHFIEYTAVDEPGFSQIDLGILYPSRAAGLGFLTPFRLIVAAYSPLSLCGLFPIYLAPVSVGIAFRLG